MFFFYDLSNVSLDIITFNLSDDIVSGDFLCFIKISVFFKKGNNADWPYVDMQKGNNVDTLLGTFPNFPNFLVFLREYLFTLLF